MPFDLILAVFRTFFLCPRCCSADESFLWHRAAQRATSSEMKASDGMKSDWWQWANFLWNCVFRTQAQCSVEFNNLSSIFHAFEGSLATCRKTRIGVRIHFIEFVRTIQLWDGWRMGEEILCIFSIHSRRRSLLKWPLSVLFPKKVLLLLRHNFCVAHLILLSNYRHQLNVHFSSHWIFITKRMQKGWGRL